MRESCCKRDKHESKHTDILPRQWKKFRILKDVRLVNGSNNAEGRVEVLYNGSWGTVCDYSWDLRDARVACRMAGFDRALDAPRSARFGEGSGDIVLDVVGCEGTEVNIAECAHRGIGVHYCEHDEDAGATCYTGAHPHPFGIRLVDGSNKSEGRVEVLYEGSWATVCDNGWDLRDAKVVCRMLGFDGALEATTSARFGQGSEKILLDLVGCDGTERNLADCAHLGIGVHYCGHREDVGAVCYSGVNPNSFGIRLVGGSNNSEGRVEIKHNGTWGTVCDDGWDLRDARVVCRMLGYSEAQSAPGLARFGKGSGEILLTLVGCDGTEDNLADCAHLGFGVHNCRHEEDAGVTCLSGDKTPLPKPIVSDVTTISTDDPTTAAYTSVSSSTAENTSLYQITFIKTEILNSTTKPALLIIILIGIGGLVFSVMLLRFSQG